MADPPRTHTGAGLRGAPQSALLPLVVPQWARPASAAVPRSALARLRATPGLRLSVVGLRLRGRQCGLAVALVMAAMGLAVRVAPAVRVGRVVQAGLVRLLVLAGIGRRLPSVAGGPTFSPPLQP